MFNSSMQEQRVRDNYRRDLCKSLGITLIEIPYWWKGERGNPLIFYNATDSLVATMIGVRPELGCVMVL